MTNFVEAVVKLCQNPYLQDKWITDETLCSRLQLFGIKLLDKRALYSVMEDKHSAE